MAFAFRQFVCRGRRHWRTKCGVVAFGAGLLGQQQVEADSAKEVEPSDDEDTPAAAAASGLPAGWQQHNDPASGRVYFYHPLTGKTAWKLPAGPSAAGEVGVTAPVPGDLPGRSAFQSAFRNGTAGTAMQGIGLSLDGLAALATKAEGRSTREMWNNVWLNETAPDGWTAVSVRGHPEKWRENDSINTQWLRDVYTHVETGKQIVKDPRNIDNFVPPSGCKAVLDLYPELQLRRQIGRATHYLSYGWNIPICDVAEAARIALQDEADCRVWFDLISDNYHADWWEVNTVREFMKGLELVQVCSRWDEPERLRRMWIMHETFVAVVNGTKIHLAMSLAEHGRMADALRANGPEAILDVVFHMKADPTKAGMSSNDPHQVNKMVHELQQLQALVGGPEQMDLKIAEATRKAYAAAIESEFDRRWRSDGPTSDVLDLGHQLAALWALTDDQDKSQRIFRQVLEAVQAKPASWNGAKIARRDRTAAALVQVLLQQDSEEAQLLAHAVEKSSCDGELAVSFQGLSVAFLANFAAEQDGELNYISTDAVVERVIKPSTKRAAVVGTNGQGRAFIETVNDQWKGSPTYFLSHAWRQTFHVSGCEWRGGAIQAMVQSARCSKCKACSDAAPAMSCPDCAAVREETFVWFDIFCVNQHLRSPYGGLQAFAFEPLRNAILTSDRVEMFLETWDDPATLSRVWCLEELRVALMLGKEVRISMPEQAMDAFRKRAEDPNQRAATIAGIDKAIKSAFSAHHFHFKIATQEFKLLKSFRKPSVKLALTSGHMTSNGTGISIDHASATFESDRQQVFGNIQGSVGVRALDMFAKEIMRKALLNAAFPHGLPPELKSSVGTSHSEWAEIFAEVLAEVKKPKVPMPRRIETQRAVALMRLRENRRDATGLEELVAVGRVALQYYGPRAEVVRDIERELAAARQAALAPT